MARGRRAWRRRMGAVDAPRANEWSDHLVLSFSVRREGEIERERRGETRG
jgi:hypothetical protein